VSSFCDVQWCAATFGAVVVVCDLDVENEDVGEANRAMSNFAV
jgi:hypothetical protein